MGPALPEGTRPSRAGRRDPFRALDTDPSLGRAPGEFALQGSRGPQNGGLGQSYSLAELGVYVLCCAMLTCPASAHKVNHATFFSYSRADAGTWAACRGCHTLLITKYKTKNQSFQPKAESASPLPKDIARRSIPRACTWAARCPGVSCQNGPSPQGQFHRQSCNLKTRR